MRGIGAAGPYLKESVTRSRLAMSLGVIGLAILILSSLAFAPRASAQDEGSPEITLESFFGTWRGTGIEEDDDELFFAVTARDISVTIDPAQNGFRLIWTAAMRDGNPDRPEVRLREAGLKFLRDDDMPNLFVAEGSGDPLSGGVMSWARLHESTLSVFQMTLNEEGGYELTSYDRTLSDVGMELVFRRLREGDVVRTVRGRLVALEN